MLHTAVVFIIILKTFEIHLKRLVVDQILKSTINICSSNFKSNDVFDVDYHFLYFFLICFMYMAS